MTSLDKAEKKFISLHGSAGMTKPQGIDNAGDCSKIAAA